MTLDDLERPLRPLFQNTCVFGAHHENVNKDRPTLSAAKMYRNSFSQCKVYADIRGVLRRGSVKRQWVVEIGNFQYFRSLFLQKL